MARSYLLVMVCTIGEVSLAAKLTLPKILHHISHATSTLPSPFQGEGLGERVVPRWLVPALLLSHLLLGTIYSAVVPAWEAHDETGHFPYVRYLATRRALPPVDIKISRYFDEAHQPPLYYLLGAAASFWIDTGDYQEPEPNPYAFDGTGRRGYNLFLHSDAEAFPWRGTFLAIHVVRLASVLMSTLAVWVTYLVARLLFTGRDTLVAGATAMAAFLPLFLFIGSVVNNDALVPLWGGLVLYFGLKVVLEQPRPRWLILFGTAIGLALLTKRTGLAFYPFAALVVGLAELIAAQGGQTIGRRVLAFLRNSALVFAPAVLVPAPWLLYNWHRYGTLLPDRVEGSDPRIFANLSSGAFGASLTQNWIVDMAQYSFKTFWGAFGWGNIMLPDGIYLLLALLSLAGLSGIVMLLLSPRGRGAREQGGRGEDVTLAPRLPGALARRGLWICLLQVGCVVAVPLYRAAYWQAPDLMPGRYLLPALPAISMLLVAGLAYWLPREVEYRAILAVGGGLAALAIAVPWWLIRPAYSPPAVSPDLQIANPIYLNFGDKLELIGYELDRQRVQPGREIDVTLLWRAKASMDRNYTIGVHVLGRGLQDLGQTDTYPGRGTYQTTLWRPGDVIRDTYTVRVRPDAATPAYGRISVGVTYAPSKDQAPAATQAKPVREQLPVFDAEGKPATPIFARFKIAAPGRPQVDTGQPVDFRLGETLSLIGYALPRTRVQPGERLALSLIWQTRDHIEIDYATFVHLIDASGRELAPFDDWQPWNGEYPTSLWDPGEQVPDHVQLTIPPDLHPGAYRLVTGMYAPDSLARLSATDAAGKPLLNDLVPLATIQVEGGQP